jgi:predicted  nucleic acid-binding Zn-ribbon protein
MKKKTTESTITDKIMDLQAEKTSIQQAVFDANQSRKAEEHKKVDLEIRLIESEEPDQAKERIQKVIDRFDRNIDDLNDEMWPINLECQTWRTTSASFRWIVTN